jgi:hypothetical protein
MHRFGFLDRLELDDYSLFDKKINSETLLGNVLSPVTNGNRKFGPHVEAGSAQLNQEASLVNGLQQSRTQSLVNSNCPVDDSSGNRVKIFFPGQSRLRGYRSASPDSRMQSVDSTLSAPSANSA